jgi:hypothetical protein
VPVSEIKADDIDGAAVMVQEGTHEKPGLILGAAFASIGPQLQTIEDRRQTTEDR